MGSTKNKCKPKNKCKRKPNVNQKQMSTKTNGNQNQMSTKNKFQPKTNVNKKQMLTKKISQCEDTSPSAFINFSFGRGPFPISLPLCSKTRCPLAYLHTFILKYLHTCIPRIQNSAWYFLPHSSTVIFSLSRVAGTEMLLTATVFNGSCSFVHQWSSLYHGKHPASFSQIGQLWIFGQNPVAQLNAWILVNCPC